jgi:hypothetical protein
VPERQRVRRAVARSARHRRSRALTARRPAARASASRCRHLGPPAGRPAGRGPRNAVGQAASPRARSRSHSSPPSPCSRQPVFGKGPGGIGARLDPTSADLADDTRRPPGASVESLERLPASAPRVCPRPVVGRRQAAVLGAP